MNDLHKTVNQKAWWLVLPVLVCVAFSAILPLMTVVNYSVQDIISPERRVFVGTEWFASVMRDEELHAALLRQLGFSLRRAGGGDPAGHPAGAGHAGGGLEVLRGAGPHRAVAADPLERGGHHLADLRARRHRPAGRGAAEDRPRLQLHRQRARRLADGAGDGRLALDAAGGAAVLRRPAVDSRMPTTRRPASTAPAASRCSATSSCPSCAAC
jgi:hypothetical protein